MKILISDATNGWIVEGWDKETDKSIVFEVTEDSNEKKTFQGVLSHIVEVFGLSGYDNDKEKLYVEVKPGQTYQAPPVDQL